MTAFIDPEHLAEQDPAERLAEIRAREQTATPGPWEPYAEYGPDFYANVRGPHLLGVGDLRFGDGDQADADRDFTLRARVDVPWLLARVDALTTERDQALDQLAVWEGKL